MKLALSFMISVLAFVAHTLDAAAAERASTSSDVVIYGATPAGIAAALAAAEGERSALLIEPTSRIGGMTTHGLSHSDFHSFEAINGPFLQFSQRVLKHYKSTYGKDSEQVRRCWRGTHGEPSVNRLIFHQMLAEMPSIRVLTAHRLAKVTVKDQCITALRFSRPKAAPVTITSKIVIEASYEGDLATRRRIEQEHLDWQLGLIHFVQTDPALPEAFREEAATWGLCRDEFADTNHIPPQIYVREARRMVGLRVYTEADTQYAPNDARARYHRDSIAVGEYSHNCHGTSHEGPMIGGRHTGEFYNGVAPYQIPYGVIVPKKMRNLLVPTACSASHVGFCAIRLEPIWMSLGGAAGHAAHIALEANIPVQQVDAGALQKRIWSQGGATIHVSDVPPGHPDFTAVQWWAGLGGLHGVKPAPAKPGTRGKHIVSQYFEAFPGHAAKLNQTLDDELRKRWTALAEELDLPVPVESTTRGDWIREVFHRSEAQP